MSNPDLENPSTQGEIVVDTYDEPEIKKEPLPSSDDNILPEPEQPTDKILPEPVTMPTNDEPPAPSTVPEKIISPSVSFSGFKPVRGRPKIMLCTRCKTFVSRDKLDKHSISKCDSIIKKREANKGGCGCGCRRRRKRRVDPQFLKDFRLLKKENAVTAAAGHAVAKKVSQLRKKLSKKKLKLLPKDVKNLFSFLEKKFTK